MEKRVFQVLDEMNQNDEKNGTDTCGLCNEMVSANKVKQGGHITMGVPEDVLMKIFVGERVPILLVLDKKEYDKIKNY